MVILIILSSFFSICLGQEGHWIWQNPLPQGSPLNDIIVLNQCSAITVGDAGTILKTYDGGENWIQKNACTMINLNSVYFIDNWIGWAVGAVYHSTENDLIFKTNDGGESWVPQYNEKRVGLNSVYFIDSNIGWAVGWGGTSYAGEGKILKTNDGGAAWNAQVSGTDKALNSVYFVDENTGWAIGRDGTIIKTDNGGTTWNTQSSGTTRELESAYFLNNNVGFALGGYGTFLKTTDGGDNWSSVDFGETSSFYSIYFVNDNIGWLLGGSHIFQSTDGGASWLEIAERPDYIRAIEFLDENIGWGVGSYGSIQKTTSGGRDWIPQWNYFKLDGFSSAFFIDRNTGWLACVRVYKTTDGGREWNWDEYWNPVGLNSIFFINESIGWTVNYVGNIYKIEDGGGNWVQQREGSGTDEWLNSVFFIDGNRGWACGGDYDNPLVLSTIDGGANWTAKVIDDTNGGLNALFFVDANTGWVVGKLGSKIFKTTDGGATWFLQNNPNCRSLNSVFFIDANTGWVAGSSGLGHRTIYRTTNGGDKWEEAWLDWGSRETYDNSFSSIYLVIPQENCTN